MPLDTTGATRSAIATLLKDFYLGPIRGQLNRDNLIYRRLARNSEIVDGQQIVIPLHVGRSRGVGATYDGGILPQAGRQGYARTTTRPKYNYGSIRISGPAMGASRTARGAFIQVLESEIRGMIKDSKSDLNRQAWADGSGRLAIVEASHASTTGATIKLRGVWDSADQSPTLKHIYPGDRIALEDISAAGTIVPLLGANFAEVSAVDLAAKTITMSGAVTATLADGDAIVRGPRSDLVPALDDSSFRGQVASVAQEAKEMMGLVGIVNGPNGWPVRSMGAYAPIYSTSASPAGDLYAGSASGTVIRGTFQNLFDPIWRANMFFNGGTPRALSLDLMQRAFDTSEEIGQATPTIGIGSYGVRRMYANLLFPDRRYTGGHTYELDGGYQAIDYNGIPIVPEKDSPEAALFFLSEENLFFAQESDFYWLDKDGSILVRVDGRDAWEATLALYSELCTDRRNAQTCIGDILITP